MASGFFLALSACSEVPSAFGPASDSAKKNADELFSALTNRFTNVTRSPKYEHAREKIGRFALTPSMIYNDTSLWTIRTSDGTKILYGEASFKDGMYRFSNVPPSAVRPGSGSTTISLTGPLNSLADGRHVMKLKELRKDEYEWFTQVDFAVGSLGPDDIKRVVNAWLGSAEDRTGSQLRADYPKNFPKTTEALGMLFSLDTIISVRDAQGANTIYLQTRFKPNGIRSAFPKYADYIDKYVMRINMRFTLLDSRDVVWFDASMKEGLLTMRTRSKGGHLVPLKGEIRSIPDTLNLRVDMTAKVKLFTIGVKKLYGQWINVHTSKETGWDMRFTKEPEWQLPLAVKSLIKTPLKRPFSGDGTRFRIGIKEGANNQGLLSRQASTVVQESGILRFLGKLGGDAMGDFIADVEKEENKFNATVFRALKEDIGIALSTNKPYSAHSP